MFVLSSATLVDNLDRAGIRQSCRAMAASHGGGSGGGLGYHFLTQRGESARHTARPYERHTEPSLPPTPYPCPAPSSAADDWPRFGINGSVAAELTAELGFAPERCGYTGTWMYDDAYATQAP